MATYLHILFFTPSFIRIFFCLLYKICKYYDYETKKVEILVLREIISKAERDLRFTDILEEDSVVDMVDSSLLFDSSICCVFVLKLILIIIKNNTR